MRGEEVAVAVAEEAEEEVAVAEEGEVPEDADLSQGCVRVAVC